MTNKLLTCDGKIICTSPDVIYQNDDMVVFNVHQNKYLVAILKHSRSIWYGDIVLYLDEIILNVIEFQQDKIHNALDWFGNKKFDEILSSNTIIRCDPISSDKHNPKRVILITRRVNNNEFSHTRKVKMFT